jgi:hypothetical protein
MLSLHAPKGSKCPCGKRATSTLMSKDGRRELLPCCTKCGFICLEYKRLVEADAASQAVPGGAHPELRAWALKDGGLSSRTILAALVPELKEFALGCQGSFGLGDTPSDPEDFGRCYRLLKLIPDGAARMGEVAVAHPNWAGMVAVWSELTALYELEVPNHRGEAPKLYARMKQVRGV